VTIDATSFHTVFTSWPKQDTH